MRKGRDGEEKKQGGKKKRRMKIVATTSLPAVDRLNADRWYATRSRKLQLNNSEVSVLVKAYLKKYIVTPLLQTQARRPKPEFYCIYLS